jgi:hypothetical protein
VAADPGAEYERLSAADRNGLTDAERRVVAFGAMRAGLNNGGFDQYFFNSAGDLVLDAIEAARSVGASELLALLQRAVEVLDVPDPTDRDARQDTLDELDDDAFADLDSEYLAMEAATDLDESMRRLAR